MLLYDADHQTRAENLAAVLGETAEGVQTYMNGAAIPSRADKTLTIWGHGGPQSLAGLAPAALGRLIQAWKARNPALTTVELVTCDARHVEDDRDSYTDKLMPLLVSDGKALVNVKCLPRGGSKATTSQLWAGTARGSNGFWFVAAESDAALADAVAIFQNVFAAIPAGVTVDKRYAYGLPLVKAAIDKAAMKGALKYVASGGLFPDLRGRLATVTVYVQDGKRYAVPKL